MNPFILSVHLNLVCVQSECWICLDTRWLSCKSARQTGGKVGEKTKRRVCKWPGMRLTGKTCFLGFGKSQGPETDSLGKEGDFPELGKAQMPPRSKRKVTKGAAEEGLKK